MSGFSNKKKKKKTKYKTIGHIWESKNYEGQFNITIKDEDRKGKNGKVYEAPGRLIFQDKESGNFFRVKTIYLFQVNTDEEGGAKAWEKGLRYNMALDLLNDNCVETLDTEDAGEEASEDDSF
jgi:hypothetical protein